MSETSLGYSLEPPEYTHCPECEGCKELNEKEYFLEQLQGADMKLGAALELFEYVRDYAEDEGWVLVSDRLALMIEKLYENGPDVYFVETSVGLLGVCWSEEPDEHLLCDYHHQQLDPRIP